MANQMTQSQGGGGNRWRLIGWGLAAALLALPFVAMQLNAEGVHWTASDFIFMGALFAIVGGLFELAVRLSPKWEYRAGFGLALLGAFLVIWVNLAVGIVGNENNPANQWFFAALLVGIVGAAIARLRPGGMSAAMLATAVALGIAFALAAMGGSDEPFVPRSRELRGTAVFAALFLASAWLFRRAGRYSA
jgi:hypothetical protein